MSGTPDGIPRRTALKQLGGTVAGLGLLGSVGTTAAQSSDPAGDTSEIEVDFLDIVGEGHRTEYEVSVPEGEYIRENPLSNASLGSVDTISDDGTTATGTVYGGTDPYIFSGGDYTISIDLSNARLEEGDAGITAQDVTVVGGGPRNEYFFEATDGAVIVDLNGTRNRGDQYNDDFSRVEGNVTVGEDQYRILGGRFATGSVFGQAEFEFDAP